MAVKSILGQKLTAKTNKKMIISRMFGFSTYSKTANNTMALFQKYSKRYHIDRVLQELELSWHVKTYSNHMRGFYVSTGEKISLDTLALVAEESKRKNKMADLKKKKAEAKQRAIAATYSEQ